MGRPWFDAAAPRVIVLVLLFAVLPVTEAAHQPSLSNLANGDFWWHLRTGIGILESHALPHTGLYSQSSAMPWTASSWLYDMTMAIGFRVLDLRVIPLAAMACKLALAVLVFLLAGGLRGTAPVETTGADNLRTLQLVFAGYESAHLNQTLQIQPV